MKKYYFLITIFSLFLTITSCSTDDSESSDPNDMLSSRNWVIESKMLSPTIVYNGIEVTDIMLFESEETRNYSFQFKADGTFYHYDATGEVILESTWLLNEDNTQLILGDPIVYDYPVVGSMGFSAIDIVSISSSKIVGTIEALFGGENYVVTITFI
ncbi:hypothetical protein [Winogradskyella sp. Asnod2-B02-A]|uniref:hypothetical protein n=1 Tax=Winogradskyella sp. Asnod2-B02-A TaxID=3160583 RepID=UPI003868F12B